MDPKKPAPAAAPAKSPAASAAEASAGAAATRRLPLGKLAVAGGAGMAAIGLLVGALVWLWPAGPDPAAAKKAARERRAAAQQAAAASAAGAPQAVVDAVTQAASAATDARPAVAGNADAPAAAQVAATAPPVPHGDGRPAADVRLAAAAPPAALQDAPEPAAALRPLPGAELPLDRLQRRLGEVLGPRGAVDAGQAGEWRVLARTSALSAAPTPNAQRRDAAAEAVAARGSTPNRSVADAVYSGPWSYAGPGGPQAWGRLKPEYATCANGQRQSPIDIRDGLAVDLEPVRFDYRPGSVAIVDTGYTVQVNVAPGNAIELMGRRYELQQFHFHRPSEQRIDGRRYDMDVHLVHKDAEGRIAVVVVLLERGAALPLLQTLWGQIPLEKGEEQPLRTPVDPALLLPEDRRYYTFMGSLTTPPCTEGVLWAVMRQPVHVSAAQIDVFAHLYPMNARPIQRSAGRLVKQSN